MSGSGREDTTKTGGVLAVLEAKAGDLLTVGSGMRLRTGEIMWLYPGGASALVHWRDTGRTTRLWPGGDAKIQHRELAELDAPAPRRRMPRTAALTQTPDKPIADAPHPALR